MSRSKADNRRKFPGLLRLGLERLEDRDVPATLNLVGGVLTFTPDAGAATAISSPSADNLTFDAGAGNTITANPAAVTAGFTSGGQTSGPGSLATVTQISVAAPSTVGSFTINSIDSGTTLPALTVAAGVTTTVLAASYTADGSQLFSGAVLVNGGATVNRIVTAPSVSFAGTVNAQGTLPNNAALEVVGDVTFDGVVGGSSVLNHLTVTGSTTINTSSIRTRGNSSVSPTNGTQIYNGPVTLGVDTTLTAADNNGFDALVTFGNTVLAATDGGAGLNVDANAAFNGNVGIGAALKFLSVSGTTKLNAGLIGTSAAGAGTQTYTGAVTLVSDTSLSASNGKGFELVSFGSTVTGSTAGQESLTIVGMASFADTVGAISLQSVSVASTTALSANVTTSGTGGQAYTGAVTISGSPTLSAGSATITFGNTVNGGGNLTASTSGDTKFTGNVGSSTSLASLSVTGGLAKFGVGVATVKASGNLAFSGATSVAGSTVGFTSTSGNVTFTGALNAISAATSDVTISGNTTTYSAGVGTSTALKSLNSNATLTVAGGNIVTVNTQSFGATEVAAGVTFQSTAGQVSFTSTLNGSASQPAGTFAVIVDGNTSSTFTGAVGGSKALQSLEVNAGTAATAIDGGAVTTTGTQKYNGAVTFTTNASLSASTVTFVDDVTLGATAAAATKAITVTGALALSAGTNLTTTLAGTSTFGTLSASGSVTIATGATVAVNIGSFAPTSGNTFAVLASGSGVTGAFANAAAPGPVTLSGVPFNVTYTGGTGSNDFVLTTVAPTTVYVDDSWAGTATGANPANSPITTPALVFGYNAFDTIPTGVATAGANTLVIFGGTYTGAVNFNQAGQTISINTNSTTPAETTVSINGAVTLGAATTFNLSSFTPPGGSGTTQGPANLNFGNTINGVQALTIDAAASGRSVTFGGAIGASTSLTVIDVKANVATNFSGSGITTTGTQTYNGNLTLTGDATLTGTTPTFGGTVTSSNSRDLTLGFSGTTVIDGAKFLGIRNLTSNNGGTTSVNGTVTTSGTQTYTDDVTLGGNAVFDSTGIGVAGNVTFTGTVQSPGVARNLTVNTGGTTTFAAVVGGGGNPLAGLTTDAGGSTQINGGSVDTTGFAQIYNDDVTLGTPSTLLSGSAAFHAGLTLGATASTATSTLQVSGDLTFSASSTVTSTLAGTAPSTFGHLVVGGNTSYGGATLVLNSAAFTPSSGDSFTIVENGGTGAGQFANASAPGPVNLDGDLFAVTYAGGVGSDLVLSVADSPVFVTPLPPTFTTGERGTFTVTAAGNPTPAIALSSGALPPGLAFVDNGDGTATISGTPALGSAGTYSISLTASNGTLPDATVTVTVTVLKRAVDQSAVPLYSTSGDSGGVTVHNPDGSIASATPGIGGNGARAAVADVTGDGVADTIVTTGPGVRVQVAIVDGATGQTVRTFTAFEDTFTGGAFVAAGDVDGDEFADIAVSADTSGGARVTLYSGKDGSILSDFYGIDDENFRGGARAALGDVNGDGLADLIVAAGSGGSPRIAVYDGASLRPGQTPVKLVNDFFAFEQTLRDGAFVSAGDVNGDGQADLIFGGGPGGGPRVLIWNSRPFFQSDGTDIDPLASFYAADPSLAEGVRVVAKDLDGDEFSDLVVGVPTETGSKVTAYLGKTITPSGTPPAFAEFDAGVNGVFVG